MVGISCVYVSTFNGLIINWQDTTFNCAENFDSRI